jgi:isoquinoline 1-oxidoreductase alpha subunit
MRAARRRRRKSPRLPCKMRGLRCSALAGISLLAKHLLVAQIELFINGGTVACEADTASPLLWVLRDTLGLTGTKYGCGLGLCGACTVHLDGAAVRSCQVPVSSAVEKKITTIEGLAGGEQNYVKRAWIAEQVPQCGYCQPGQIMSAAALLASVPHPTEAEIDRGMTGNLCRCGTYARIRRAIHRAANEGHP